MSDRGLQTIKIWIWLDSAGTIYWIGEKVDKVRFREYIDLAAKVTPSPSIDFKVDPAAPCAQVAEAVAIVSKAVDCRLRCTYQVAPFRPASFPPPTPPPPPPPRPR